MNVTKIACNWKMKCYTDASISFFDIKIFDSPTQPTGFPDLGEARVSFQRADDPLAPTSIKPGFIKKIIIISPTTNAKWVCENIEFISIKDSLGWTDWYFQYRQCEHTSGFTGKQTTTWIPEALEALGKIQISIKEKYQDKYKEYKEQKMSFDDLGDAYASHESY